MLAFCYSHSIYVIQHVQSLKLIGNINVHCMFQLQKKLKNIRFMYIIFYSLEISLNKQKTPPLYHPEIILNYFNALN